MPERQHQGSPGDPIAYNMVDLQYQITEKAPTQLYVTCSHSFIAAGCFYVEYQVSTFPNDICWIQLQNGNKVLFVIVHMRGGFKGLVDGLYQGKLLDVSSSLQIFLDVLCRTLV